MRAELEWEIRNVDLKKSFEALIWIEEEKEIEFIWQCQLRKDRKPILLKWLRLW